MYEAVFQLTERPFLAAPRADRYFPGTAIEAARQVLTRAIERGEGPGLVVGAAGTGKSLLCEVLAAQFKDRLQIAHLQSARLCTRRALLQAILYDLNLPYRERDEGELRLSLIDHLSPADPAAPGLLLLVDEAHALPILLLEEIRMITNLVRNGEPRVRLVLAGSGALEERFASPKLESFSQRIAARCYLDALEPEETSQYVRAQMAACGSDPDAIFTPEAYQAVHRATDGIPRLINQVCDHALVLASASGVSRIEASGIEEAWADLQQLPMPWSGEPGDETSEAGQGVIEFGTLDDEPQQQVHASEVQPIPFPKFSTVAPAGVDLSGQVEKIQQQLNEADDDFQPVGTIGPEVELNFQHGHNPFAEAYDDEEVVIDRYASLDEEVLRGRPRVVNRGDGLLDGNETRMHPPVTSPDLSLAPGTSAETPSRAERTARAPSPVSDLPPDHDPVMPEAEEAARPGDSPVPQTEANPLLNTGRQDESSHEIIVVEDEPARSRPPVAKVRRQEYRQLFAKLRKP